MRTVPIAKRGTRPTTVLAGVLLTVLALVGCSGTGSGSASDSGAREPAATAASPAKAFGAAESGRLSGDGASPAAPATPVEQRLVRTATLDLQTRDVTTTAAKVRSLVTASRGFVADERTDTGRGSSADDEPTARSRSVLTLRVPAASLDEVMQQVGQAGTVLHRSQSSQDVSAQYVDTESRVRSQTASVVRVRALLSRATRIGDVVQIEGELARRQSDLEALQAQLASLQDRTTLSTLTVTISSPAVAKDAQDGTGFVAGLHTAWTALRFSVQILLTLLGALLPFAVLTALVAVPTVRWRRDRARRAVVQSAQPAQPTQPAS